jgi:hypothetical protein
MLTFCVRALTFQFMRAHLNDPGWFQVGSYVKFDRQARAILKGEQRLFWIDDPTRTDLAQYPPGFPAAVAFIYKVGGDWSVYAVQNVQWILDLVITFALVSGIAITAFGWRAGIAASYVFAFSPVFAMYGAYPSADVPSTWFVLAGCWLLVLAAKRISVWFALGAGVLLGIACWFRVNPLYLCVAWPFALFVFTRAAWRRRLTLATASFLGTVLVISPIVLRNYLVFPDFTPTGGTIGANLWEGLGETDLGQQHGFLYGDDRMVEHERRKMGLPPGGLTDPQWPDGIRRDRERVRQSLVYQAASGVVRGCDARPHVGHVESCGRSGALHRHRRHKRDERQVFAARTARRRPGVCRKRTRNDPEPRALSLFAHSGCGLGDGVARRLADRLCVAGDDCLLSRCRHVRPHGGALRGADARVAGSFCRRGDHVNL